MHSNLAFCFQFPHFWFSYPVRTNSFISFFRGAFDSGDVTLTGQALTALCAGLPAFIW